MARIEKINEAIRKEISNIVLFEVKDPRLKSVTITHVDVSRDLQYAKVFFSFLGSTDEVKAAQEGLDSASGFIRRLIGQRIRMRYTPEIHFIFDKSIEYGIQIEQAIEKVKNELKNYSSGN